MWPKPGFKATLPEEEYRDEVNEMTLRVTDSARSPVTFPGHGARKLLAVTDTGRHI